MIKLEVQDYCQDCPYFEADISHPIEHTIYNPVTGREESFFFNKDTTIRCKHRNHCANLVRKLKGGQE